MLAFIFGTLLAVTHYFSETISIKKYKMDLLSFGGGISISYIFLGLLPELNKNIFYSNQLFLFVLLGFVVFHILEKSIYQHAAKEKLIGEIKELHSLIFFIYHFALGVILFNITQTGFRFGILFFIPLFFHTAISTVSLNELHYTVKKNNTARLFLSLSTLFGVIAASFFGIDLLLYSLLLGLIVGALLYTVVREEIPQGKKGKPKFFLLGVFLYSLLIFLIKSSLL